MKVISRLFSLHSLARPQGVFSTTSSSVVQST